MVASELPPGRIAFRPASPSGEYGRSGDAFNGAYWLPCSAALRTRRRSRRRTAWLRPWWLRDVGYWGCGAEDDSNSDTNIRSHQRATMRKTLFKSLNIAYCLTGSSPVHPAILANRPTHSSRVFVFQQSLYWGKPDHYTISVPAGLELGARMCGAVERCSGCSIPRTAPRRHLLRAAAYRGRLVAGPVVSSPRQGFGG